MICLASQVFQDADLYSLKTILAVKADGKIISDQFYRGKFQSIFSTFGSFSINVSSWRHYVKFIFINYLDSAKNIFKSNEEYLDDEIVFGLNESDYLDETIDQFGHSKNVALSYGSSNLIEKDFTFFKLSQNWHSFLKPNIKCHNVPKSYLSNPATISTLNSKENAVLNQSYPSTTISQQNEFANHQSNQCHPNIQAGRDLKRALEKIHGSNAQWRSSEQSLAALRVYINVLDYIIVLPTGEGKTDIIATCVLSPKEVLKKTLFLVPTTSLAININERFSKYCNSARFSFDGQLDHASIVIATYEQASSLTLKEWVQKEFLLERLRRIVMDECHTLMTWGDTFCLSFKDLQFLRPPSLQIVFMSATLPTSLLSKMKKRFLIDNDAFIVMKSPNKSGLEFSRMVSTYSWHYLLN
jgi:hypothetical protein